MIRQCKSQDFESILAIINDAAKAYRGVIPADQWREPYMPAAELREEIAAGVKFYGYEQDGRLIGVMGVQAKGEVTLIRHAYVRTIHRNRGIGGQLLRFLYERIRTPVLIGTWASAAWAIAFYQKHGFRLVGPELNQPLLHQYWTVSERHLAVSVALADERWFQGMFRAEAQGLESSDGATAVGSGRLKTAPGLSGTENV
jgi:N-acetylglutamate synthase-like GNAT family acetyltransferase